MESTALKMDSAAKDDTGTQVSVPEQNKTLSLATSLKDKLLPMPSIGGNPANAQKRDWSSALDLVNEAFEAIRISEERAVAAEEYHQQLVQHQKEQVKSLEARIAAAEKRAEAAESRSKDAEAWLAKFHDTIVNGFQRTFVTKDGDI